MSARLLASREFQNQMKDMMANRFSFMLDSK